jgi:phosphohistidine phosphatase
VKRIFMLRHAKTEKSATHGSDHERELLPRGHANATEMARWLGCCSQQPQLILCSSATRTQQTYQLFKHTLPSLPDATIASNLYLASAGDIFYEINKIQDDIESVMIIGHNPGIKEFCVQIANDERPNLVDAIALNFPTCALAVFEVPCTHWNDVAPGIGQLVEYMHPARLPEIST